MSVHTLPEFGGDTPLHLAAGRGHWPMVRYLLSLRDPDVAHSLAAASRAASAETATTTATATSMTPSTSSGSSSGAAIGAPPVVSASAARTGIGTRAQRFPSFLVNWPGRVLRHESYSQTFARSHFPPIPPPHIPPGLVLFAAIPRPQLRSPATAGATASKAQREERSNVVHINDRNAKGRAPAHAPIVSGNRCLFSFLPSLPHHRLPGLEPTNRSTNQLGP